MERGRKEEREGGEGEREGESDGFGTGEWLHNSQHCGQSDINSAIQS